MSQIATNAIQAVQGVLQTIKLFQDVQNVVTGLTVTIQASTVAVRGLDAATKSLSNIWACLRRLSLLPLVGLLRIFKKQTTQLRFQNRLNELKSALRRPERRLKTPPTFFNLEPLLITK